MAVWSLFFKNFDRSNDHDSIASNSIASGFETDAKDELEQLQIAKDAFKTPNKRPRITTTLLGSAMDTQEISLPKRTKMDRFNVTPLGNELDTNDENQNMRRILDQWNELIDQLELLQTRFDQRIISDQKFRESILHHNLDVQAELGKLENMSRLLQNSLGELEDDLENTSIIELIRGLIADNTRFKREFENVSVAHLESVLGKMRMEIVEFKKDNGTNKLFRGKLEHAFEQITKLSNMNKQNLELLNQHYRKSFLNFRNEINNLQNANMFGNYPHQTNNLNLNQEERNNSRLEDIENDIKSAKIKMNEIIDSYGQADRDSEFVKLESRVKDMESRISGDSCSVNEGVYIFTSETEVTGWLKKNEVVSLGYFWDIFSVLVVMPPKQLSRKERADRQFSSDRINTTSAENDLAASMAYERPPSLYGDKNGTIGPLEQGFIACNKHSTWIRGSESYKTKTTNQLKKFEKGLLGTMSHRDGGYGLARALLNEVVSQWTDFVGFVDAFFQDLTETANLLSDKAWKLVGQCCGAIFDAMEPYRAVVCQIEDLGRLENKSKFLWCALQCHRVMKDFVSKQFRGHPQMVKQISLFMIHERVDPVEFGKMEVKVSHLEQVVSKQEKTITAMNRTLVNYENLSKILAEVQRKVKALESKK